VRLRSRSSTIAATKVFGFAIRGAFLGRAKLDFFFHRGPLADAEAPALPMTPESRERPTLESWDGTLVREDTPTTTTERTRASSPDGEGAAKKNVRTDRTFTFDRAVTLESLRQDQAAFAAARDWDQFHTPRNVLLAMVGEVGELSELFQWRGDAGCGVDLPAWSDADKTHLGEEMADVLLYLVRLADRCGVDLPAVAKAKLAKNEAKYPAEKCFGSAAKYTAYV
jgi:dCTP diphosphatase